MDMQSIDNIIKILMSDYFKRKRRECGLSGKAVGRLLRVSQQHISRYERGETHIPLSAMLFFLKSKNFNLDNFFYYLSDGIYAFYKEIDNTNVEPIAYNFLYQEKKNNFEYIIDDGKNPR